MTVKEMRQLLDTLETGAIMLSQFAPKDREGRYFDNLTIELKGQVKFTNKMIIENEDIYNLVDAIGEAIDFIEETEIKTIKRK